MTRRHRFPVLIAAASMVALTACGSAAGDEPRVESSDSIEVGDTTVETEVDEEGEILVEPPYTPEPYDLPDDPDALVFSLAVGQPHGQQPIHDVSVTADGRVFLPVEAPGGFQAPPGVAPQSFVVRQLTDEGFQGLLDDVAGSRLVARDLDFGDAGITDQGFTTLTLHTPTHVFTQRAYALDFTADDAAAEALRIGLRAFVDRLQELRTLDLPWLIGEAVPFEPPSWTVESGPGFFDRDVDGDGHDDNRIWPDDPAAIGPCVDLDESLFDGGVAGSYRIEGSEVVGDDGEQTNQVIVVDVVPTFPWVDCDA